MPSILGCSFLRVSRHGSTPVWVRVNALYLGLLISTLFAAKMTGAFTGVNALYLGLLISTFTEELRFYFPGRVNALYLGLLISTKMIAPYYVLHMLVSMPSILGCSFLPHPLKSPVFMRLSEPILQVFFRIF